MKLLASITYLFKYTLLGVSIGFIVLFFIPSSPMPFNWFEAKKAWQFYKNIEKDLVNTSNQLENFSYSDAVAKAGPSVVSVKAFRQGRARPARGGKPGDVLVDISVGVGSGVIFDKNGHIVTNYHVISDSVRIAVHFSDGSRKFATVVGFDQQNDIAVLKVDKKTPLVAELGQSSEVKTGDIVMAIGTPFGLFANSVTLGIVSAIDHGPLNPRIQTDASINYGNSGGALINTRGQVIGISSAKFSLEGNDEIGINFGAPIDIVKESFDQIIKLGKIERNWLGVRLGELNRESHRKIAPHLKYGTGLFVGSIEKGSPSAEAGLKEGDLLIRFDNQNISNVQQFSKLFTAIPIGKRVNIEVLRKGSAINMWVKLRERPNN